MRDFEMEAMRQRRRARKVVVSFRFEPVFIKEIDSMGRSRTETVQDLIAEGLRRRKARSLFCSPIVGFVAIGVVGMLGNWAVHML